MEDSQRTTARMRGSSDGRNATLSRRKPARTLRFARALRFLPRGREEVGNNRNHLAEFVDALEKIAEAERIADLERKEENRRWEEARRRCAEEQARRKREVEKERHLEEQALRWSRATIVSDYLAALGSTLRSYTEPASPEIEEWFRWSETYVQRLCPIRSNSFGLLPNRAGASAKPKKRRPPSWFKSLSTRMFRTASSLVPQREPWKSRPRLGVLSHTTSSRSSPRKKKLFRHFASG